MKCKNCKHGLSRYYKDAYLHRNKISNCDFGTTDKSSELKCACTNPEPKTLKKLYKGGINESINNRFKQYAGSNK